jgi:hypothetical protein
MVDKVGFNNISPSSWVLNTSYKWISVFIHSRSKNNDLYERGNGKSEKKVSNPMTAVQSIQETN